MKPKIQFTSINVDGSLKLLIEKIINQLNFLPLEGRLNLEVKSLTKKEIHIVNIATRCSDKPTNILTFTDPDDGLSNAQILICKEVIADEASKLELAFEEHFTHTFIHGILHAYGYDHQNKDEKKTMHQKENNWMHELGYSAPWES
jgi:probable rRNA maturation factor